jgi:catechol 2,3-dioxygenase
MDRASDTTTLPAETTLGPVRLRVADLDRASAFYARAVGLHPLERSAGEVHLGPAPGRTLVELVAAEGAPARPRGATGLFHLAILVPGRAELARALHRVAEAGWAFTGASDHLVSEALYLDDPEGNGIEIYRDRPREEWRTDADGQLEMATLPLDLDGVIAALPRDAADEGMDPATTMGHVHLQVRDIPEAEGYYADALGFAPTVRGYPGALFVSAGGYHHHLGLNTWGTRGGPAPPAGALGLEGFRVVLPTTADVDAALGRLADAGHPVSGASVTDPSGNRVTLEAA